MDSKFGFGGRRTDSMVGGWRTETRVGGWIIDIMFGGGKEGKGVRRFEDGQYFQASENGQNI